jgi:hypothetical protein
MVQDEKSDVMQVGAAATESPTQLPQCGSGALVVGAACVAVFASNWRQLPGDSGKRARAAVRVSFHSSEHRCAGTRTSLVIGAAIVSPEVEDISMVPVIRPSDRQRGRDVTRP